MANSRRRQKRKRSARADKAKKTGRPEFSPSRDERERVEILVFGDMGEEDIARVLGISRGTLRKHFKEELMVGTAKRRAEVILAQYKSAVAGNVSAQKQLLAPRRAPGLDDQPDKPRSPALGKKEQRKLDALAAPRDPEWGDLIDTELAN